MLSNLSRYSEPILSACFVFPFIAAIFTLPFMIINYRKFGGIALMRVLVVYSFILYSMCAFLLTVLPLPTRASVAATAPRPIGWIPGNDLMVGLQKAGWKGIESLFSWSVWKKFLCSSDLFQILANIVMQIPLGFYLRYYFRCSWKKTLLIGFCVSLFYELTQLSGLYFIYPHNYRYTQVDDLINNTLGAMIGYWITPVLGFFLPTREEIDKISYDKGQRLTIVRRLMGAVIDMLIFFLLIGCVLFGEKRLRPENTSQTISILISAVLYFGVLPYFTRGRLPGHALLKLRVVHRINGGRPQILQLLMRYLSIYILEPMLLYMLVFLVLAGAFIVTADNLTSVFTIVFFMFCVAMASAIVWYVVSTISKHNCFPHSWISKTEIVEDGKPSFRTEKLEK